MKDSATTRGAVVTTTSRHDLVAPMLVDCSIDGKGHVSSKRKAQRGGARNTGMKLANNTSGLSGIWFQRRQGSGPDPVWHVYVCSAWTDKEGKPRRTAYSVKRNTKAGALMCAIAVRVKAGLPVPSMTKALAALNRFLDEVDNNEDQGADG